MIENKTYYNSPNETVHTHANEIKYQDILNIILRRKISIILILSASIIFVIFNQLSKSPEYRAVSVMMISNSTAANNPIDAVLGSGTDIDSKTAKKTVELLYSMPVAELIVKELWKSPDRDKLEFFGNRPYYSLVDVLFGNTSCRDNRNSDKKKNQEVRELSDEEVRQYAVQLSNRMKVEPVRDTNILRVSVASPFADEAVILSNTVCQVYKSVDVSRNSEQYAQAHKFIAEMLIDQQQKVDEADAALTKYMAGNEMYEMSGNVQQFLAKASEIDAKLNDLNAEYNISQNNISFVEKKLTEADKALSSRIAGNIKVKLGTILDGIRTRESEYLMLVREKGINSSEAIAKKTQLDYEKTRYEQLSRSKIAGEIGSAGRAQKYSFDLISEKLQTEIKLNLLNNSAAEYSRLKKYYEDKLSLLPKKQQEYAKLQRDREVVGKTYVFLKQRLDETRIMLGSEIGEVRVLGSAFRPFSPESSGSIKSIIFGFVLGSIISFIYVFWREIMDDTIKDQLYLKKLGFNTLAVVPFVLPCEYGNSMNVLSRIKYLLQIAMNFFGDKFAPIFSRNSKQDDYRSVKGLAIPKMTDKFHSEFAESFRTLRTSLDYNNIEIPLKSILVSGTTVGEGKSTICTNLGLAFALAGKKTVIVDSDLRFATQHINFNSKREHGLTDYLLSDKDTIDQGYLKPTKINNLYVLTAGHNVLNPNELIGSEKMKTLINELEGMFDKILFDTPPLFFSDAAQLCQSADGILLTARLNYTSKSQINEFTEHTIMHPQMLGIALIDPSKSKRKKYLKYAYRQFEKKSQNLNKVDIADIKLPA
jgi:capsular exopolysaccharide synthesis family protein